MKLKQKATSGEQLLKTLFNSTFQYFHPHIYVYLPNLRHFSTLAPYRATISILINCSVPQARGEPCAHKTGRQEVCHTCTTYFCNILSTGRCANCALCHCGIELDFTSLPSIVSHFVITHCVVSYIIFLYHIVSDSIVRWKFFPVIGYNRVISFATFDECQNHILVLS